MSDMSWRGVMPAVTTPFAEDGTIDHAFLEKHIAWMIDYGATGIIPLGSLGEGATLTQQEKRDVITTCLRAVDNRVPIVPGIAATSTDSAVALAREAAQRGCRGLMVLPPYVHKGPDAEIEGHIRSVIDSTDLECMLYNNPIAYGNDIVPERITFLAEAHSNLVAVKESSGDVRRMTAIKTLVGDRLAVFAGLDDVILEGIDAGATGWVAGLVNALPAESVALFSWALGGEREKALTLYRWFLPLLRLDTVPEFVQLIKLVQQEVGMGTERVRAPRTPAFGEQREQALRTIRESLAASPFNELHAS